MLPVTESVFLLIFFDKSILSSQLVSRQWLPFFASCLLHILKFLSSNKNHLFIIFSLQGFILPNQEIRIPWREVNLTNNATKQFPFIHFIGFLLFPMEKKKERFFLGAQKSKSTPPFPPPASVVSLAFFSPNSEYTKFICNILLEKYQAILLFFST